MKCPRRSVVVHEVRKVCLLVRCSDFVDEYCDLEADSSSNKKPVQIFKDRFDMVLTACTYQAITTCVRQFWTHSTSHGSTPNAGLKRIAIVLSTADDGTCHSIFSRMVHGPSCLSKTLYVKVRDLAAISRMLVKCDCDAEVFDVIRQNYRCTSDRNWSGTL